jgi:hypothetical protein
MSYQVLVSNAMPSSNARIETCWIRSDSIIDLMTACSAVGHQYPFIKVYDMSMNTIGCYSIEDGTLIEEPVPNWILKRNKISRSK